MLKRIGYVLLSVFLLASAWLGGTGLSLLVGFVPLLLVQRELEQIRRKAGRKVPFRDRIWPYAALTFGLWWGVTTWWVGLAVAVGAVLAVLIGGGMNLAVFMLYNRAARTAKRPLAYTLLITGWMAYEMLYLRGEISFPWLTLGNGFATTVWAIQWYEYTGVFGGSLWVLLCNLLIFEAVQTPRRWTGWILPAGVVTLPLLFSGILYGRFQTEEATVSISVVQPNFDPYEEKFYLGYDEQNAIFLDLVAQTPRNVDYVLLPETALGDITWEEQINYASSVQELRGYLLTRSPATTLVCGASTWKAYPWPQVASTTARQSEDGVWIDAYNSALMIDTSSTVGIHHKSILVVGAEKMPYYEYTKNLDFLTVDLGGITGQMGVDSLRRVFTSPCGVAQGTAICYESIYGDYFREFVQNGAQVMFVITNDGWWGDTPGHHQHFSYARLRAIENRRPIARSANTGISGFIDARGEVGQTLGWDTRGVLTAKLHPESHLTVYTRYGDYLGRLACYIFALSLLYWLSYTYKKRSHLVS